MGGPQGGVGHRCLRGPGQWGHCCWSLAQLATCLRETHLPEALLAISSASSSRSCSAWRRARSDEASSCGRLHAINHFPRGDTGLPCCPTDKLETREHPGPRVLGSWGALSGGAWGRGREEECLGLGGKQGSSSKGQGAQPSRPCGRAGGSWQTRPGQGKGQRRAGHFSAEELPHCSSSVHFFGRKTCCRKQLRCISYPTWVKMERTVVLLSSRCGGGELPNPKAG